MLLVRPHPRPRRHVLEAEWQWRKTTAHSSTSTTREMLHQGYKYYSKGKPKNSDTEYFKCSKNGAPLLCPAGMIVYGNGTVALRHSGPEEGARLPSAHRGDATRDPSYRL